MGTVLAVCSGSADLDAAESSWSAKAQLGLARFSLTTCVVDEKIYAMGGGDAAYGPYLPDVEIYNPATDSWETGIPMPNARLGHTAAVVGGKIYVMGGAYEAQTATSTVDAFDPATGTWATKTSMPRDRVFHCAGVIDEKIYLVGGCGSGWNVNNVDVPNVDVYDPATDTWTTKGKMRSPRAMASAVVVNSKIYVFGGIVGNLGGSPVSTADVYDPATDSWKPIAGRVAGSCSGISAVGNKIYLMGSGSFQGLFSRTDIYDTTTGTWQAGPRLSMAKCFLGASLVSGKIFLVGGCDVAWPWHAIATVEAYTPPPALSITRQDGSMTLSWTGILQELDGQAGWQWRDILPQPTSPWTIQAPLEKQMNCYRSRSP